MVPTSTGVTASTYDREREQRGFSTVCTAVDTATGEEVAIKIIDLLQESSNELCVKEIQVMRDYKNANLVTYVDSGDGKDPIVQIMM
ncbi:hypothetical protein TURU_113057 [Turdus rufiventris]|nr:hypothetical protein TURU_113057 [Turdus rufiventris]